MNTTAIPPKDKIDLIYIASTGRSGSTLLETILGAHPQITTTGEIQVWPHDLLNSGNIPCGCGKLVPKCPFWSKLHNKIDPLQQASPQIHFFREKYNAGKTLRWTQIWEFWQKKSSAELQNKIKIYGENNYHVFQSFLELLRNETGKEAQWIVDSSKDPYRLNWLIQSNMFNIKVLHVVKDPRAFVYSMTKEILRDEETLNQKLMIHRTIMKSLAWVVQNYLFSQIANHYLTELDYLHIPYEKLASDPNQTLQEIYNMIGCASDKDLLEHFWDAQIHTVAGNPMRSRKGRIVLDEAWKTYLPTEYRKLTEIITGSSMSRYGY